MFLFLQGSFAVTHGLVDSWTLADTDTLESGVLRTSTSWNLESGHEAITAYLTTCKGLNLQNLSIPLIKYHIRMNISRDFNFI